MGHSDCLRDHPNLPSTEVCPMCRACVVAGIEIGKGMGGKEAYDTGYTDGLNDGREQGRAEADERVQEAYRAGLEDGKQGRG